MARHHELTDAQWERIRGLLHGKTGDPGRTAADNRLFVNAVLFVLKIGIPWEDLPERYGKPNTIWKRFDRWCAASVWEQIARTLGDLDLEELQMDSTTVKAHPVASTGRRLRAEKRGRRRQATARPQPRRADYEGVRGCRPMFDHDRQKTVYQTVYQKLENMIKMSKMDIYR